MTGRPSSQELADRLLGYRYLCPEHRMPDCSPLLNGCSLVNHFHDDRLALVARLQAAEQALRPLAYPFAHGEPTDEVWARDELTIDCCVTITYGEVLAARRVLEGAAE